MLECSVDALARLLRKIARDPEAAAAKGHAAVERVRAGWTWEHSAARVEERIQALAEQPPLEVPVEVPLAEAAVLARPMRRPKISLCMIVRNEERVLGECLRSARPWVDEILLVDTGSTDQTVEIAAEYGATISHFPWCEDFAAARNASLTGATGDWILWIDADDTIPPVSGEAILEAVRNAPEEVVGFVIPVQFVDDGSPGAGTRVDHVKLFRNRPGLAFEGRIHEQILPALVATGGLIARCGAVVLHSGYDTSPEGQARKRERDRTILELDLQDRPDHPFVLFNLGMTAHHNGEHEAAVRWLERCLEVSGTTESHVRKAYALLGGSLRQLERTEASLAVFLRGLDAAPGDPELHFHAANILTEQERYPDARDHYLAVIQADISNHFSSVDMGILGYKAYHNLASVYEALRDYSSARDWWLRAVEEAPQFLPSVFALFNAALEVGDRETAQQMLNRVKEAEGESGNALAMEARFREGQPGGSPHPAENPTVSKRAANGERMVTARQLLQVGREAEAVGILQELAAEGVAEAAFYLGVSANRSGNLPEALHWMRRAQTLNPNHAATRAQVENLLTALEQEQ